jgi:multidrug resistance efflux pump
MTDTMITARNPQSESEPAPEEHPTQPAAPNLDRAPEPPRDRGADLRSLSVRVLVTLTVAALAAFLTWKMWDAYMGAPWTRDGSVRVYVATMASEVSGRIVQLPVRDNQFVHKGDLLMVIDPMNYDIAVKSGEASVDQTKALADNAQAESVRRDKLDSDAVSDEVKQTFRSNWVAADANHRQAQANLAQARVNLERTRIVSPVNGYVTNLLAQLGDFASVGENLISVVDADSFWVDGYFEETNLEGIRVGDPASIKLMGFSEILRGHVDSIARGINVQNAQPNSQGLATVNPIFTWVRLAQRVPVRIHLDQVPPSVVLSAGMTATVQIEHR